MAWFRCSSVRSRRTKVRAGRPGVGTEDSTIAQGQSAEEDQIWQAPAPAGAGNRGVGTSISTLVKTAATRQKMRRMRIHPSVRQARSRREGFWLLSRDKAPSGSFFGIFANFPGVHPRAPYSPNHLCPQVLALVSSQGKFSISLRLVLTNGFSHFLAGTCIPDVVASDVAASPLFYLTRTKTLDSCVAFLPQRCR